MRLAPCLFQRLADVGVSHAFGIPGDVALPLFEALDNSPIRTILTTHEPSAGFVADAYARMRGIGLAVVTYGADALNMVNAIGQVTMGSAQHRLCASFGPGKRTSLGEPVEVTREPAPIASCRRGRRFPIPGRGKTS